MIPRLEETKIQSYRWWCFQFVIQVLSRDSVTVTVDAVIYYRVSNPTMVSCQHIIFPTIYINIYTVYCIIHKVYIVNIVAFMHNIEPCSYPSNLTFWLVMRLEGSMSPKTFKGAATRLWDELGRWLKTWIWSESKIWKNGTTVIQNFPFKSVQFEWFWN